ncbi:hypothetical protein ONE63_005111 [Megalurothrips usitatus]|uniref:Uncharacterized protein n=1 Tax=Megalurothrips usitatus TaxID=439358 RepID=A0AAV7XYA7_9NEOP|nr:hypothetical protein ONE63_005111 [Megalurothrips usitatus]
MDDKDRARLEAQAKATPAQTGALTRIAKEHASILNLTLSAVKAHEIVLSKLEKLVVVDYAAQINQTTSFGASMRMIQNVLAAVRSEVRAFFSAWTFASTGNVLSPDFIPPLNLISILGTLAQHVPGGLELPITADATNIHHYYSAIKVNAYYSEDEGTRLFLHVPLVSTRRRFTLYRALPWPYRINESDIYTYYQPETPYIAVNSETNSFMHLTQEDVGRCDFDSSLPVCHPLAPVYQGKPSCTYALLMSDPDGVHRLCEPMFAHKPADRFLGYAGGRRWLFSLSSSPRLSVSDTSGRPLTTKMTQLPITGSIRIPKSLIVTVGSAHLYAGASFASTADIDTGVLTPDLPPFTPASFIKPAEEHGRFIATVGDLIKDTNAKQREDQLNGISLTRLDYLIKDAESGQAILEGLKSPWTISSTTFLLTFAAAATALWCCCRRRNTTTGPTIIPMTTTAPEPRRYQQAEMIPMLPVGPPGSPRATFRNPRAIMPPTTETQPEQPDALV